MVVGVKEISVSFTKKALSKFWDPWVWFGGAKGFILGAISMYLFLEGWPF